MDLFSLVIQPMIEKLQADCTLDLRIWCVDNRTLVGFIPEISKATQILQATGVILGYHLEVEKSQLWCTTV